MTRCEKCNTEFEGTVCPNCEKQAQYEAYKRYYPDKMAAMSALRRETGLGFSEANHIINQLFGTNDDDECRKADGTYKLPGEETAASGTGLFAAIKAIFSRTGK